MLLHFKIRATHQRLGSNIEANFALFNSAVKFREDTESLFVPDLEPNLDKGRSADWEIRVLLAKSTAAKQNAFNIRWAV